ncbi:hypothetical protein RIF29_24793 [Crotalaria pallida]|uniref:Peptidase C14 caspase domain-containing protein n=1 Tax=Crotalaria pallida TaxID=3830 RepID=A0AAN9HWX5_CROPI
MTNILLAVAADCTGTRRCLKGKAATSIHYIVDHMEKTYKFDKVRILTDVVLSKKGKTLTAKGLLELLKYYIGKLKPGDNLVFIFAGHGAEGSGCWGTIDGVETLDAVHGIVASDLEMISSEELTALLEGLDPSCSVTIITEACHSSGLITGLKHQLDGNMSPPYTYEDASTGWQHVSSIYL